MHLTELLRIALSGIVAAAALVSGPTQVATSFAPSGGPDVNLVGSNVSFTNLQAHQALACEHLDFTGTVVDPGTSRPYGTNAGILDALTISDCTHPIAGRVSMTLTGTPTISITGNPVGTAWPARLCNVSASIEIPGCSFDIAGSVNGVFDTATQVVTPTTNTLTITDPPVGKICPLTGFAQGQSFTVQGSWTNVPPAGSGPLTLANP